MDPMTPINETHMMTISNPMVVAMYPPMADVADAVRLVRVKYTPHSVPSLCLSIWRVKIPMKDG